MVIIPRRPIIIGYATLTRLGPSPVQYSEKVLTPEPEPKKFRLPLFGSAVVPAHSTRIISTANILIACPLLNAEPAEIEPAEVIEAETIAFIPAIGRYVALRPGYYLLDCHIERICGTRKAQAQKIIRIRRRLLKPVPVPVPEPVE